MPPPLQRTKFCSPMVDYYRVVPLYKKNMHTSNQMNCCTEQGRRKENHSGEAQGGERACIPPIANSKWWQFRGHRFRDQQILGDFDRPGGGKHPKKWGGRSLPSLPYSLRACRIGFLLRDSSLQNSTSKNSHINYFGSWYSQN